jgi:hypothetical protein
MSRLGFEGDVVLSGYYGLPQMTPEAATSSHYFVCSTRRLLVDDPGFSTMIAAETLAA